MHQHLQFHKQIEILVMFLGMFTHEVGDGFPLHIVVDDRPLPPDPRNLGEPRDMQSGACLSDASEVERLVEDIRGRIGGIEKFDGLVPIAVNHLFGALGYDLLGRHGRSSSLARWVSVRSLRAPAENRIRGYHVYYNRFFIKMQCPAAPVFARFFALFGEENAKLHPKGAENARNFGEMSVVLGRKL